MSILSTSVESIYGSAESVLLDKPLFEIFEGNEVSQPLMSTYSNVIASILCSEIYIFLKQAGIGRVVSEVLFRMLPEKKWMRRPDVAFVSYGRWAQDQDIDSGNGWEVVPDLAVEVVSPTDLAVEVMGKVYEYLEAGVVEVWLVYPELRRVHRFGPSTEMASVGPDGTLDGGSLLPGFQLPLKDLFRNKA